MIYLLSALLGATFYVSWTTGRLSFRIRKIEREMLAKIDRARHEGWNEGREYQIALDARRHPRNNEGKFTAWMAKYRPEESKTRFQ